MPFDPGLTIGDIISNDDIRMIFMCSTQGGMRRSRETNTLVLTSDPKKPLYQDEWYGEILHYTGMGTSGDQDLNFMQNKTLAESDTNGVDAFLFEKLDPDKYLFQGRVELASQPYQQIQKGEDGRDRKVWIFPLKVIGQQEPAPLPEETWQESREIAEREASRLSDEELKRRAKKAVGTPSSRPVISRQATRNSNVTEYVKRQANGRCQLCKLEAPFNDIHGQPFLEIHHIVWLSKGGEDSINNTVALCPNCHRKMHILDLDSDKESLLSITGISKTKAGEA